MAIVNSGSFITILHKNSGKFLCDPLKISARLLVVMYKKVVQFNYSY